MDKYAVLRIKGKQYRVAEGQEVLVDRIEGDRVEAEMLLYKSGDTITVGKPLIDKVKLAIKIINSEEKGNKIDVFKYKSKSRYRKHVGFRPKYTRILIEKIG